MQLSEPHAFINVFSSAAAQQRKTNRNDTTTFIYTALVANLMGRIKTALVKRSAEEIVEKFREKLTKNFSENKVAMAPYLKAPSTKLKNAILGYATRIIKMNKPE